MSYNGWSNYETWRINLEMFGGVGGAWGVVRGVGARVVTRDRDDAVANLAEYFSDTVHELIESESRGFAHDLAVSFLNEVDWQEIAAHYIDDYVAKKA